MLVFIWSFGSLYLGVLKVFERFKPFRLEIYDMGNGISDTENSWELLKCVIRLLKSIFKWIVKQKRLWKFLCTQTQCNSFLMNQALKTFVVKLFKNKIQAKKSIQLWTLKTDVSAVYIFIVVGNVTG